MESMFKTFSAVFGIALVAMLLAGGGWLLLLATIAGYAVGMYFVDNKIGK